MEHWYLFSWQLEESSPRKGYALQADAEEALQRGEREHLQQMGHRSEHETTKVTALPPHLDTDWHGAYQRERLSCRETDRPSRAWTSTKGNVWDELQSGSTNWPEIVWPGRFLLHEVSVMIEMVQRQWHGHMVVVEYVVQSLTYWTRIAPHGWFISLMPLSVLMLVHVRGCMWLIFFSCVISRKNPSPVLTLNV